jgi:hypothetical protein
MPRSDYGCQRCGKFEIYLDSLTLTHTIHAVLCVACRNAYDVFADSLPTRDLQQCDAQAHMLLAQTAYDGIDRTAELMTLTDTARQIRAAIRPIIRQWIDDGKQEV